MYNLNDQHRLLLQYDKIEINNANLFLSRIGYEYNSLKNYFLRFGLKGDDELRLGVGYIFNFNDNIPLVIDYSLDLGSQDEGVSHLFTWGINL